MCDEGIVKRWDCEQRVDRSEVHGMGKELKAAVSLLFIPSFQ